MRETIAIFGLLLIASSTIECCKYLFSPRFTHPSAATDPRFVYQEPSAESQVVPESWQSIIEEGHHKQ